MSAFDAGALVVLKSGSMRMVVEAVEDDRVSVIWAHEGAIGRETLPAFVLSKWEDRGPPPQRRDDDRREGGGKPFGGPRKGGGKPWGDDKRDDRGPRGMDGKPRQKTHYRAD